MKRRSLKYFFHYITAAVECNVSEWRCLLSDTVCDWKFGIRTQQMIQPPEIDELKNIPVNVSAALTSRNFNQVNIPTYARSQIKSDDDVAGAVSAIVSTLPGVDLRFMKIRRNQKMEKKVVVSFYQERMLREIFTELDFIKCGVISCKELRKASNYVEMRMANMSTAEGAATVMSLLNI